MAFRNIPHRLTSMARFGVSLKSNSNRDGPGRLQYKSNSSFNGKPYVNAHLPPPTAVLKQYPLFDDSRQWSSVSSDDAGFSGSGVWFNDGAGLVLKAVPAAGVVESDLQRIHHWIESARKAGIETLPAILPTARGQTAIPHDNRFWVLTTKRPGRADFCNDNNDRRLRGIVDELARLHRFWSGRFGSFGPIPGVIRRLAKLDEGQAFLEQPSRLFIESHVANRLPGWEEVRQLNELLPIRILKARQKLQPLRHLQVPIHPCLCDCWHDHFLFEGDQLSGVIDFDAVKIDHAAVDLARAIGSLLSRDKERWWEAYNRYREVNPAANFPFEWIEILHETGQIVAGLYWLRKLVFDADRDGDISRILPRVKLIVESLSPDRLIL